MKDCKKITALLLAAIMLSSCSETTPTSDDITSVSAEDAAVETALETEDPYPYTSHLPSANYEGYVFNIMGETMSDHFESEELNGEGINDAVYQRNLLVEDKYNVDLQYQLFTWGEGAEKIRVSATSGDNSYDLITATHQMEGGNLTSGYFLNWNEMTEIDLSKPYYVQNANNAFSIGDKTLLLFGDFMDSNISCCWSILFNKSLVEQYGITGLYDKVDAGEWTLDYFLSLIENVYEDKNGNGQRDQDDFYGFFTDKQAAVDSLTRSFHLSAVSKDENNYPVLDFYKESTVDAYAKIYEMYYNTVGIYATEGAFVQLEDSFVKNRSIFSNCLLRSLYGDAMRAMEEDYGVLPTFKYFESDEIYATHLDGNVSSQMLLVTHPEDTLDRTCTIVEALNAYSRQEVISAIYDVALKTKVARDADSARMLDYILEGRMFSFDSFDESGFMLSPMNALRYNIRDGVDSIASYYKKYEKGCSKWLTKMIEAFEEAY